MICRFNSLIDQHLLSWLEEYPWTKSEIALTWLTLLWCNVGSAGPPWWHHMSSGSSRNNPGISWLWSFRCKTASEEQFKFTYFLLAFLECPKRCRHLSIGEAPSTYHFAHLCAQIVLNSCLGSTNSPLYKDPTVQYIANSKGKTPQQVLLMWGLLKGWSVIPKSVNKARIEQNFQLDGWELTAEEIDHLSSLKDRLKVCGDSWLPIQVFFGDDEY